MQSCIYAFCKTKAMDQNTYLQKRVQDQQQWYSDKSSWNQKRFRTFKTIVIILSVSIPLATGYVEQGGLALRIGIGLAGALIAILEGISTFNKYQEKWLEPGYRRGGRRPSRPDCGSRWWWSGTRSPRNGTRPPW